MLGSRLAPIIPTLGELTLEGLTLESDAVADLSAVASANSDGNCRGIAGVSAAQSICTAVSAAAQPSVVATTVLKRQLMPIPVVMN